MGKIYARLIHKNVVEGIDTPYSCIEDVPAKYQEATRVAYRQLYGVDVPSSED